MDDAGAMLRTIQGKLTMIFGAGTPIIPVAASSATAEIALGVGVSC